MSVLQRLTSYAHVFSSRARKNSPKFPTRKWSISHFFLSLFILSIFSFLFFRFKICNFIVLFMRSWQIWRRKERDRNRDRDWDRDRDRKRETETYTETERQRQRQRERRKIKMEDTFQWESLKVSQENETNLKTRAIHSVCQWERLKRIKS